jgi:hypothetical protein
MPPKGGRDRQMALRASVMVTPQIAAFARKESLKRRHGSASDEIEIILRRRYCTGGGGIVPGSIPNTATVAPERF